MLTKLNKFVSEKTRLCLIPGVIANTTENVVTVCISDLDLILAIEERYNYFQVELKCA